MDFSTLPPEINSSRMYAGPGSGPLLAAAAAWQRVGEQLNSSAAAYRSVIGALVTDGWRGPSSAMMANAAAPFVAWMHRTAAQAEQTAGYARAAAAAYEGARAAVVPPPVIAANRARLLTLVASNFFGQNSPAIAATEADYERMWAQDANVMYGYQASSAAAANLTPFTGPPNPVTQPSAPAAAAQLAAPAQAIDASSLLNSVLAIPALLSASASTSSSSLSGAGIFTTNHALFVNSMRDQAQGIGPFYMGSVTPLPSAGIAATLGPAATTGRASLVGTLSVPQTWAATATPPVRPAAAPASGAITAPTAPATSPALQPGMFGEAMLGTLAGRGASNAAVKARRPSVIPRSPAAG